MNAKDSTTMGLEQAQYAKNIGLDYLEIPVDRMMQLDDDQFEAFKNEAANCSLPCLACNNFLVPSIRLAGNEFDPDTFENYVKKALARIASVGIKKVVFGSGRSRSIPSYLSDEEGIQQVIECIKFITATADSHGLDINIEHLNRAECNCINTFEESVSVVKQLNLPNVKCLLDYYHFSVSGENINLILQNEDSIGHIHFARTMGRIVPDLDDLKKMKPVLDILKECSYDGTLSLEAFFPNSDMENLYYKDVITFMKDSL